MEQYSNQVQPVQPWYLQPWQVPVNGAQTAPMPYLNGRQGNNTPVNQPGFKICPVASYDEAKAIPTDFLGSMIVMPDLTHGFIYTKVFNPNTGSSMLGVFKSVQIPDTPVPVPQENSQSQYDAKSEIDKLQLEITHIKQELGIDVKKED